MLCAYENGRTPLWQSAPEPGWIQHMKTTRRDARQCYGSAPPKLARLRARPVGAALSGAGCSLALSLMVLAPLAARAESLNEALTSAFAGNPGLDAERARQRADQETIRQERARGLPNLSLDANRGKEKSRINSSSSSTELTQDGYALTLTQPLFQGFQIYNGTRRAKAEVRAGAAQLHDREQTILLDTVTAYMDVVQDREIARLRNSNIQFLRNELNATKARRRAGDLSKTDVAQARSRLFEGKADFAQAQANAEASEASFEAIIGHAPGVLTPPRAPVDLLPPSLEKALGVARNDNPAIVSALHSQEAARLAKKEAYGALLPSVSLELSHSVDHNVSTVIDEQEESSLFVRMSVPLYQGGELRSRIRQSRASESGAAYALTDSRRRTRAGVIDAWKQLHAAKARISAASQQVNAARAALKGVQIEVKVGERALFEILDAQRELVNGQVALARAERDHVVSSYTLLAATGRLTARYLRLHAAYPDLDKAVRKKASGGIFSKHRQSRRASSTPPQAVSPQFRQVAAPARIRQSQAASKSVKPAAASRLRQTMVDGAAPATPVRQAPPMRTYRLSSVKPAHKRARRPNSRAVQNPLSRLRTSIVD